MRLRSLLVLLILILSPSGARADDWEICNPAGGNEAIAACTRLITSGKLNDYDLGGRYIARSMAREDKGDLDGAIADYDQAIKIDRKTSLFGFSVYAELLASKAYKRGDYATALRFTRPLADEGNNRAAQFNLGQMYENGLGVPQDYTEAAKWYRLAADQGFAHAQYQLGFMYFSGQGVPQNDAEAARLYRLAAQQDDARAEQALGLFYFNGVAGVTQSYAEAVKWYTPAAEQGLPLAQFDLGVLYANGDGVPQDYVRAHMWFNLSAAQGDKNAIKDRDRIARQMTPEQIAEAQKLAREFKPRKPRSK
jgi:uncharacterized protein